MTFRFGDLRVLPILAVLLWLSGCDDTPAYNGPGLPAGYSKYQRDPNPVVKLDTDLGAIKIELLEDRCPETVDNFVELTEQKFYDGNSFSRVIKDVFIFAGAKNPDGTGGPGYTFRDEIGDDNKNDQYAVGMINEDKPNSNGSQFYIVTAPKGAHWLDKKNTVFGKVTDGKDVVDKINLTPLKDKIDPSTQKPIAGTPGDIPVNPVKITKVEVVSKRNRTYKLDEKSKVKDQPPMPPQPPSSFTVPPGTHSGADIQRMIDEQRKKQPQVNPPPPTVPPAKPNELPKKSGDAPKAGSEPPKVDEKPKQPDAAKQPETPKQPEQPKKDEKSKTGEAPQK